MNFKLLCVYTTIILLAFYIGCALSIDVEQELRLTKHENQGLQMLKMKVMHLTAHDWMKSDLSLIRWLRAKNLNVEAAEQAFKENIKWRNDNSIDSILEEDWSYFKEEYFFEGTGTDFTGRPVCTGDISDWNVREAMLSGRGDQLLRYMLSTVEAASRRVRKSQAMGLNVTQWQTILNMDNFNLVQHGCFQCLPLYLNFISAHDTYYPFAVHKIIIINTPAVFQVVLNLVRPVMSRAMQDSLIVVGTNKAEWKKTILSMVSADQLAPQFGGSKRVKY